jgi:hypothetical protein
MSVQEHDPLYDSAVVIENDEEEKQFKLYGRRWIMLVIFCLVTLSASAVQMAYASVSASVTAYYGYKSSWASTESAELPRNK